MPSGQHETGGAVVEARNFGVQPVVRCMAVLAGSLELRLDVARIGGRREILQVAGVACRRHRLEFTVGPIFVTGVAVNGGMGTRQRKPVVVLLYVLNRNLPSPYCVALFAVGA